MNSELLFKMGTSYCDMDAVAMPPMATHVVFTSFISMKQPSDRHTLDLRMAQRGVIPFAARHRDAHSSNRKDCRVICCQKWLIRGVGGRDV
jgi:hypothetical protein